MTATARKPGSGPRPATSTTPVADFVDRRRRGLATAGGALLLVLLAVLQRPGETTFDTKLDMAVDPLGFMSRALHLWNPQSTSGELQQQAYGYLFPMGPFFALGDLLNLPSWVTQRAWTALLLCAAYLGVVLLARAMNIGTEPARLLAGLAYALAPRMLTEIGPLSSEMLPVVALPWVMLPLVSVHRLGSARRAAALSAVAVLFMSGINAAATVMALVLPALWLATRRWDRNLAVLAGWWCLFVAGATLWWLVPLLLFGEYSLPFLDYIESSATTTAVTSLFQALRGTNQWVGYIEQGEPWWPAGWVLVNHPALMAATALVALVALVGLTLRGLPERRFLALSALTGLALLTTGYLGTLDSPLAPYVRDLLDGPLAPLRNVHKWEPVLRLPLVLGLAHAATRLLPLRWVRIPALPVVASLLLVASAPAWLLILRPGPGWTDIPPHWRQAAAWLGDQDAQARTLVVPGSGFARQTWGRTIDEPLQPLAEAPWATRNQIPLSSEGNIRVMDTVEAVLAQGRGSPALADFLARNGYRYLLVRHDVDRALTGAPPVAVVRQAIAGSPGLVPAASFGSEVGVDSALRSPVDERVSVPAIEIFAVDREVPVVSATTRDTTPLISGGPESLLGVLEQGLIDPRQPVVLAGDPQAAGATDENAPRIVTDGLRRRELNVGRMRDNVSHTLTADEETRQGRVRSDLLPFDPEGHQTVAVYQGIRSVRASSGTSFADTLGSSDVSHLPFAALDGDPATVWRSDPFAAAAGQWIEVTFDTPRRVTELSVDFAEDLRVSLPVGAVRIGTDQGIVDRILPDTAGPHRLETLPGLTTTVRVTVLGLREGYRGGPVALRELDIPGADPQRGLRAPADLTGPTAPVYAFSRAAQERAACYTGPDGLRCDQFLSRIGEEPQGLDRFFATPVQATYNLRLTARPRPGAPMPLDRPVAAGASSVLAGDVAVGAHAAVDGDAGTAWLADAADEQPTLTLSWRQQRGLDRIRLVPSTTPVSAPPREVTLRTASEVLTASVDAEGWVRFPQLTTDRLEITVNASDPVQADTRDNGWPATPGIAEVEIPALTDLLRPADDGTALTAPCGSGPTVEVAGFTYPTSVSGTLGDLRAGRSLPVTICDDFAGDGVELNAGENRLRTVPSATFIVDSAALMPQRSTAAAPRDREVTVDRWEATDRAVTIAAGDEALLVVPENFNAGWTATLNGSELTAVRVDGWQQAFTVPAGEGGIVTLTFTPDGPYRIGLAVGALAALLVLLAAFLPAGRFRPHRRSTAAGPRAALGGGWWIAVPVAILSIVIGGVVGAVLLLAAMLLRQLRPQALPWVVFAAGAGGVAVAVAGNLLGHSQEWAYGVTVQSAMLTALSAVAATLVPVGGGAVGAEPEPPESAPEPAPGPAPQAGTPHRATLGRSVALFRGFLQEQSDPDRFYSLLATDSVRQLGAYVDLAGARVLDVGGGPGYFATEFRNAGAGYIGLDPEVGDFAVGGVAVAGMVRGSGTALPVRSGSVDVCYSSNVLEHVSAPEAMLDEMARVTRPGGTIFVSFTPWFSPWGGHETSPWHFLGGEYARKRYLRRHGKEPKNRVGQSLFPVSAARAMRWARARRRAGDLRIVDVLPRYHPGWAKWVAWVPGLREVLTWNFTMVLRNGMEIAPQRIEQQSRQGSHQDVTQ